MANKFKILIVFVGCLLFRLIPLRAPNVEPIMASIMPIGSTCAGRRKYGAFVAFAFGFLSIFLYDLITHFGAWTWVAAITYGVIGVGAYFYFERVKAKALNFVIFTLFATVVFDFITGVLFAPMFGQTMWSAFILQIPFTALHLAGNIGFALTLSPILTRWLISEKVLFPKKLTRTILAE
ncbi:MAG: hypothetical protein WCO07_02190 [bacterium]